MGLLSECKAKKAEDTTSLISMQSHAIYGDDEIVIALDGEVLEGGIPIRQRKMLEGWMAIHEDELMANWKMLSAGEGYFKIEPLK